MGAEIHMIRLSITNFSHLVFNIIADFILALFPWMVTWKLRISLKEKIALCITMSLGVVVAIISAVRTAWMEDPSVNAYNDYYFCKSL